MNNLLNFKSFFKFLRKNKGYTAIDIFGLSVSLMFVILIAVYTQQELSVNQGQEKADRVYALGSEETIGSHWRLKKHLISRYPEIEEIVPVVSSFQDQPIQIKDMTMKAGLLFSDTSFFDVFSYPLLIGDTRRVIEVPNYAVVSESFARKAFGSEDPLGQMIHVNDSVVVTVNGIMKDIKNSIFPEADILLSIENIRFFNSSLASEEFNNATGANLFVLVKEGADLHAKLPDVKAFFSKIFWWYKNYPEKQVILYPWEEIYFSEVGSWTNIRRGDWDFVMILMSVGILILLFAVINYINLTVAQTGKRAKEMATRRLLGSSRGELFSRLIMESTLLSLFSFVLGFLLALAVLPFANDLLQTRIDLTETLTPVNALIAIGVIVVLGLTSGLLPAWIISNSKPIDIVRGGFRTKTKMVFSKIFITFQNVITIMMIAASMTMVLQINHMINAPLGYNMKNIIDISSHHFQSRERIYAFGNEVSQLASVNRVAYGAGTPFSRGNNNTMRYEDRNISFQTLMGDSTYFSLFGFEVLQDNQLASADGVYLNEQAYRELMISDDTPSFKYRDLDRPIAGKLKDFRMGNILADLPPTQVMVRSGDRLWIWDILIEINGDPKSAFEQVKEVYEKMMDLEMPGYFMEDQVENSFSSQRRTAKIVMIFCVIAILISLLGLLAMSTYFIQQRSREIAVRKVFGSSEGQVLKRLIFTFLNYVGIAFVIATPLVWYIMRRWLMDYSYRISLSPLIFIGAGLFCLLISFLTVYYQSYRAANANPVDSVKAE
ncbi:ABC transporter permease [Parabacteroides sp. 52]|uniref:ABC transporter permease n=1 Tax=unclassified Parabacteroides TaxID=2649774 RepID=UPI0013D7FBE7|nr:MULTISPECIES: FtsX-like permease family protein [unclassified Parabacteroides]MDH6534856.1 putative ABC transport system permease protein [Parabacteroides sp. PM5-20]NDV55573.1 ABC transporter permease [Parabacteroides sp. 52]